MDFAFLIQTIAIYALPVLFAVTVHEAAHGYAALYFGDKTAWSMGRVTLNPTKHIDPIGTILMPLMLYVASGGTFLFGYAKPVPVRFGNLRKPKRDMIWVALAGPIANLAMAFAWGIGWHLLKAVDVTETFFLDMCAGGLMVNVALFAFNMLPIPPLDGGRVAVGLLPVRAAISYSKIEPYTMYAFLGMALLSALQIVNLFPVFYAVWMQPVMAIADALIQLLLTPFSMLLG